MKSKFLLFVLAITAISTIAIAQPKKMSQCDLKTDMRKLWEDHITWTRNVILNIIDGLQGAETAVPRLLQNQQDIGDKFAEFYGQVIGDSLAALLTIHITTAADLLNALLTGDQAAITEANDIWYENGEDIVAFLISINPQYDEEELDEMMDMHLDLTANEAVARLTKDYAADVAAYDAVHDEVLAMSDFLVDGIIAQFSKMFKHNSSRLAQTVELSDLQWLGQNYPNPFTDQTVISYSIPDDAQSAVIEFRDATGRLVKSILLEGHGDGDLTVQANRLSKGIYTYSLIIDGHSTGMKKMVH